MIRLEEFNEVCQKSLDMIDEAGILLTPEDRKKMTAADFGLSNIKIEGVQILTMFETDRIAGKILVLLPYQTEPEHWHPTVGEDPGKEEIIRAVSGDLYFYIAGKDNMLHGFIVDGKSNCYTMRNEVVLKPGKKGAVMYSFSSKVTDLLDQFSDPDIVRETIIEE
jgi:D-lyxose ketol-isomerase